MDLRSKLVRYEVIVPIELEDSSSIAVEEMGNYKVEQAEDLLEVNLGRNLPPDYLKLPYTVNALWVRVLEDIPGLESDEGDLPRFKFYRDGTVHVFGVSSHEKCLEYLKNLGYSKEKIVFW
jgi:hypothetical protein